MLVKNNALQTCIDLAITAEKVTHVILPSVAAQPSSESFCPIVALCLPCMASRAGAAAPALPPAALFFERA